MSNISREKRDQKLRLFTYREDIEIQKDGRGGFQLFAHSRNAKRAMDCATLEAKKEFVKAMSDTDISIGTRLSILGSN